MGCNLKRVALPEAGEGPWVKGGCRRQADTAAGLPLTPEMPRVPRRLRLVPHPDIPTALFAVSAASSDRQNGSTRREARSAPQQDQEYRLRRESARVITVTMSTAAILSLVNGSEVSALLSALDRYDLHV